MPLSRSQQASRTGVFLIAMGCIVHVSVTNPGFAQPKSKAPAPPAAKSDAKSKPTPPVRYATHDLPQPVIEMREAILAAVRAGRVEELKTAIELNEMKPTFGDGPVPDPIGWLKQMSADGEGREVLAHIANILEAGFVTLPLGRDPENTAVFVWPHFAETDVRDLTPEREVELLRLVPAAAAKAMRDKGAYDHWRIGIGADGVWHFLRR